MTFYVGQKVVCVDGKLSAEYAALAHDLNIVMPTENSVYTIRDIVRDFIVGKEHCRLVEIKNPIINWLIQESSEPAFSVSRFRPAVERKTDISVFTEMLTPKEFVNG